MGDIIVYEFCGDDGCDICSSFTGFSIDEIPERPHPNCLCEINEIELDEDWGSWDSIEIEETDHNLDSEWIEMELYYDNCDNDESCHVEYHLEEDAEICVDSTEAEAKVMGYACDMMDDMFEFDIPPHHHGTVKILKEREIISWEGLVRFTYNLDDGTTHETATSICGTYEHNYNISGEVDFEPCD